MAIESAADFASYANKGIGSVSATFSAIGSSLWDSRTGLIDTFADIDSGNITNISLNIDQDFFNIQGATLEVAGYQPRASVSVLSAPNVTIGDKITVQAVTTRSGAVLTPQIAYKIVQVEPDHTGITQLTLAVD